MTEEPYRWLEAIGQRREYVESRLAGGSPVFAASLESGVLLLGVGSGQSKVFEIFDRHAMAGLGHPADLERLRQAIIDAAHLEAFNRAPEDITLRRLISFGIAPSLKTQFEQLFSPPTLARALFAELGATPGEDTLVRVEFDGTFHLQKGGFAIVTEPGRETAGAEKFLREQLRPGTTPTEAAGLLMAAWKQLTAASPGAVEPVDAVNSAETLGSRVIELGLLQRNHPRPARYAALDPAALGLIPVPAPTP